MAALRPTGFPSTMVLIEIGLGILVLVIVAAAIDVLLGLRRIERLAVQPAELPGQARLVSLVVAARDEERSIEPAARSLLAQHYPALEILAIDDRSTDRTGILLDALAREDPRLQVLHIVRLPDGWLGKNHALATGAARARGDWLLFTDADVVMAPDAIQRAVGYCERHELDHLAVLPGLRISGTLLQAFVTGFAAVGLAAMRPWTARKPGSKPSVGMGAFNLVRTEAYRRAGGHDPIRLRPDDDLKLGKLLKRAGARADVLVGKGVIWVEWYRSIGEAIHGLMKNSFAVVEYQSLVMLGAALGYLILGVAPVAALFLGTVPRILGLIGLLVPVGLLLRVRKDTGTPVGSALLFPVVSLLLSWIVLRALVLTLARGGIVWRGTFYPLAELRKNRI